MIKESSDKKFRRQQSRLRVAFMKGGGTPEEANRMYPRFKTGSVGIIEKAVNFTKAVGRRRKLKKEGKPVDVSEKEASRRWNICTGNNKTKRCDEFKPGTTEHQGGCKLCGCGLHKKVWWATEACPLGKWGNGVGVKSKELVISNTVFYA